MISNQTPCAFFRKSYFMQALLAFVPRAKPDDIFELYGQNRCFWMTHQYADGTTLAIRVRSDRTDCRFYSRLTGSDLKDMIRADNDVQIRIEGIMPENPDRVPRIFLVPDYAERYEIENSLRPQLLRIHKKFGYQTKIDADQCALIAQTKEGPYVSWIGTGSGKMFPRFSLPLDWWRLGSKKYSRDTKLQIWKTGSSQYFRFSGYDWILTGKAVQERGKARKK